MSPPTSVVPDYSVVIPAFNEEQLLPRTLRALFSAMAALGELNGEVIVVDNNSTDLTTEVASQAGARVVFEPVNQIARARNKGAEKARGQYLVFLDADTLLTPELLREALAALVERRACGGGTLMGTSDAVTPGIRRTIHFWNWLSQTFKMAAGSFVFCLRQAWQDVHGFPETVYASEELFFSRALQKWGKQRGLAFIILKYPVDTSMRKTRWYCPWQLLWMMVKLVLFPWHLKKREHCALWYSRPGTDNGQAVNADERDVDVAVHKNLEPKARDNIE